MYLGHDYCCRAVGGSRSKEGEGNALTKQNKTEQKKQKTLDVPGYFPRYYCILSIKSDLVPGPPPSVYYRSVSIINMPYSTWCRKHPWNMGAPLSLWGICFGLSTMDAAVNTLSTVGLHTAAVLTSMYLQQCAHVSLVTLPEVLHGVGPTVAWLDSLLRMFVGPLP